MFLTSLISFLNISRKLSQLTDRIKSRIAFIVLKMYMVVNFYTDIQLLYGLYIRHYDCCFHNNRANQCIWPRYFYNYNGLKKKHKRADINSTYTEIVKRFDFKKFTKEYLQARTETLIIDTKIGNKKPSGIWTLNPLLMAQKR